MPKNGFVCMRFHKDKKVYCKKINSLAEGKEHIYLAVWGITPEMLQNVFCKAKDRFEICRDTDRTHEMFSQIAI